jgi:hypothetical protein
MLRVSGRASRLVQDHDVIQINRFSAFVDDSHKMIAGGEFRGTPHEVEGLLVETIRLIVNEYRYRPETLPALIAQTESFPCKSAPSALLQELYGCLDLRIVGGAELPPCHINLQIRLGPTIFYGCPVWQVIYSFRQINL